MINKIKRAENDYNKIEKVIELYKDIVKTSEENITINFLIKKNEVIFKVCKDEKQSKSKGKERSLMNISKFVFPENIENAEEVSAFEWDKHFFIEENKKVQKQIKPKKLKKGELPGEQVPEIVIDKYNINHVIFEEKFHRSFMLKNYENIDFNSFLYENSYINIHIKKSENIIEKLELEIYEKEKELKEELSYEIKEKKQFIISLKNENNENNYESYVVNIFQFIANKNNLEELEKESDEIIDNYNALGIEANIITHHNISFYKKIKEKISDFSVSILYKKGKTPVIINYISLNIKKDSIQNVFKIEIMSNGLFKFKDEYLDIFEVPDISYYHSRDSVKLEIFDSYKSIINGISSNIKLQVIIENELLDRKQTEKTLLARSNYSLNDGYNEYLLDNIEVSIKDSTEKKIYFVLSCKANSSESAFQEIQKNISFMQRVTKELKTKLLEISIIEKIGKIKNMISYDYKKRNNKIPFNPQTMRIVDYISPVSIKLMPFEIQNGLYFSSTFCIGKYPNKMKDTVIASIVQLPIKISVSLKYEFEELSETIEKVGKKIFEMERDILGKKRSKTGYISYELKDNYTEALQLRDELNKDDKKLIKASIYVTVFAKSKKELNEKVQLIISTVKKQLFIPNRLFLKQEIGLLNTLPFSATPVTQRDLLSENVGMFMPFYQRNTFDADGIFYGLSDENNIISIDRRKYMNSSGWFLGVPGSGKSFLAKKEMLSVILRYPEDEILIIDPEAEYGILAKECNGENIKISTNSKNYINPFDITTKLEELRSNDEDNPIKLKQEFLITFIEMLAEGMSQSEKSIVDRIITEIYREYMVNLEKKILKKPNLKDFYNRLLIQDEDEAGMVALRIELYVNGSLNLFANETTVNIGNRIVNFNIKELGGQLKNAALVLICDMLWQKVCKNRDLKKRTWIYIDEIYLLFENESSAKFLFQFYKRVRKYGGVPTGITQNIEDLLRSEVARTMLSNAAFLCILRQSTNDREHLKEIFDLSDMQANFVKNNAPGTGLIIAEGEPIHFSDKMNTKSAVYKTMTTKIDD